MSRLRIQIRYFRKHLPPFQGRDVVPYAATTFLAQALQALLDTGLFGHADSERRRTDAGLYPSEAIGPVSGSPN